MSANADAAATSAPGSNLAIAIRRGLTDGAGIVAILYVILFALYALWDRSALTASGVTNLSNNAAPLAIAGRRRKPRRHFEGLRPFGLRHCVALERPDGELSG